MGVSYTGVKLLLDLQILDCELHKIAFGGRGPPGLAGELRSQTSLAVIRGKKRGREGGREDKGWE